MWGGPFRPANLAQLCSEIDRRRADGDRLWNVAVRLLEPRECGRHERPACRDLVEHAERRIERGVTVQELKPAPVGGGRGGAVSQRYRRVDYKQSDRAR